MKRLLSIFLSLSLMLCLALPARAESFESRSILKISDGKLNGEKYEVMLNTDGSGDGWDWDCDSFTLTLSDADLTDFAIQINNPKREVTVKVNGTNQINNLELFDRNSYLLLPYDYSLKMNIVGTGSLECAGHLSGPEVHYNGPSVTIHRSIYGKQSYFNSGTVTFTEGIQISDYEDVFSITGGTVIADIRESSAESSSAHWLSALAAIVSDDETNFFRKCKLEDENGAPVSLEYVTHEFPDWGTESKYVSVKQDGSYARYVKITNPSHNSSNPQPTAGFTDVPSTAYYAVPVSWAVDKGITAGTGDGTTFSPNETCTRKQIVTFLWRAAGQPEPSSTNNPFTDVPDGSYYHKAVLWAVENGITTGTGDGTTFSPDDPCTRKQIVTFLYRTMEEAGIPLVTI